MAKCSFYVMANLKGSTNVAYVYKLLVCDSSKMFHLAAAQIEKNVSHTVRVSGFSCDPCVACLI